MITIAFLYLIILIFSVVKRSSTLPILLYFHTRKISSVQIFRNKTEWYNKKNTVGKLLDRSKSGLKVPNPTPGKEHPNTNLVTKLSPLVGEGGIEIQYN